MSRARILADYVSSGDELADKAPLASSASINITGTITDTYFLSLAYVLTGDVTLSGTNVLGKIVDGTTNVSITNDGSTRTLSGSGTLLVNSVMFN